MNTAIIPAKNEPSLNKFALRLYEVLEDLGEPFEVLIIMGDRESLHPEITPRHHLHVYKSYADDLSRAILCGLSHAKGSRIVVCDSDSSHPVSKIPEMLRLLDEYDMVIGSRFLPGSVFSQSAFRKMVSRFFIWWAHLNGSKLTDPMSGYFSMRKSCLDGIMFKPFTWKTALEISLKMDGTIKEVPIEFGRRNMGLSKANWGIGLRIIWDIMNQ